MLVLMFMLAYARAYPMHHVLTPCMQISPVVRAGCYAPGGRFPLPSSVLMTAVTARAAGTHVISPRARLVC